MANFADCTIVVLSYNTCQITRTCLAKIAQLEGPRPDVIVVDSASSDGSSEMIEREFPRVKLVKLNHNLGPGAGYNAGMKRAKTKYILIINSDTYLPPNLLKKTLGYMADHPGCDGLICRKVDSEGQFEPYCGNIPTPLRTIRWLMGFESVPWINKFLPRIYGYPLPDYEHDFRVGWAPTFFFLLKKEVYTKTGGHDEAIFLYMDDVEWFKRINDAGFKIWYTPIATVVHLGGSSTKKKQVGNQFLLANQVKSIAYMQRKHYPRTWWLVRICLWLGMRIRGAYYLCRGNQELGIPYWHVQC